MTRPPPRVIAAIPITLSCPVGTPVAARDSPAEAGVGAVGGAVGGVVGGVGGGVAAGLVLEACVEVATWAGVTVNVSGADVEDRKPVAPL